MSEEIGNLTNLRLLDLRGNPLPIQKEILESYKDSQTTINYFLEFEKGDNVPLNEGKIILVGQGNVGKTSLAEALEKGKCSAAPDKTEGLEVKNGILI